jgi:trimethylamine-N-oxide reductase (cytochrome c)
MSVTRRDLLKLGACASLYAASGSLSILHAGTEDAVKEIVHATHYGPLKAVVKNGKFTEVLGVEADYSPTSMLFSLPEYVYSDNRIKYPCVRRGFLNNNKDTSKRGLEEFVRVSWETALDLVAEKLKSAKEIQGNESIFRTSFAGWAHPGVIGRPDILQGRFLGLHGGFTDTIGDYSAGAATHALPHVLGSLEIYSYQTTYEMILKHTKNIILWGADPLKTFRINYTVPDHKRAEWFVRFKNAGIKFTSIDPLFTDSAKEFEADWIDIRPATDVALILALCHELFVSRKYSRDFMEKYTVGFSVFLSYLLGKDDEVPKSPEWAEKICKVKAGRIRELATLISGPDTLIISHYGCQRSQHGEQFHWGLITLACMAGQVGTAGSGFHFGEGGLPFSGKNIPKRISQGRNPSHTAIPASRVGEMLLNPGRTIDFNGNKITYPKISLVYSMGANVLTHHQNINELLEGMKSVECVIAQDIVWTPSVKYSDIVLPVTTSFERNDLAYGNSYSIDHIWAMKQVIEPLYEAKDDYWILSELAERLGFKQEFTQDRSMMDWIRWSYESMGSSTPFDEFWTRGFLRYDIPDKNKKFVRLEDFRKDPAGSPLFTPSGKIEIYSEKVASFGYKDCPGHPAWMEPSEWLGSEKEKKHRYHLISPHPKDRLHSQMDNLALRNQYKINGREPVMIHPDNAKELGLLNGDLAEIYNDRGKIICGVHISSRVRKNVVKVDEGAWYAPENPEAPKSRCLSGNVNVLTSSCPTSKLAQACSANTCLVSVKKVKDYVPPNSAYENPVVIKEK